MNKKFKFLSLILVLIVSCSLVFSACKQNGENSSDSSSIVEEEEIVVKDTEYDFVVNGKSDYRLVVPDDANEKEMYAMNEFSYFFREATNIQISFLKESEITYSKDAKIIVLGNCNKLLSSANITVDKSALKNSGFTITTADQNIFITGGKQYGTVYGVYEFLRRIFNYETYGPDAVTIEKNVKYKKLPDFAFTMIPDIDQYVASNGAVYNDKTYGIRLGALTWPEVWIGVKQEDGRLTYAHNFLSIVKKSKYGDRASEGWFGTSGQTLCLTNESMYKEAFLPEVKELILANPDVDIINVAQEDSQPLCACSKCIVYKNKYGTYAALSIVFCNKLARDINDWIAQVSPGRTIKIALFAYQDTIDPPVKYNAETEQYEPIDNEVICDKNVITYIALSSQNPTFSMYGDVNKGAYTQVKGWQAISKEIQMWTYAINFKDYFVPYNVYNSIGDLFKFYKEVNCQSVINQSSYNNIVGPDFYYLKAFLESKLRWNVNANVEKLIEAWFDGYFEEASSDMKDFFNQLRVWFDYLENNTNFGTGLYSAENSARKYWPKGVLDGFMNSINAAQDSIEPLAQTNKEKYDLLKRRIDLESLDIRRLLILNYEEYMSNIQAYEMKKKIKEDILSFNIKEASEMVSSETIYADWNI